MSDEARLTMMMEGIKKQTRCLIVKLGREENVAYRSGHSWYYGSTSIPYSEQQTMLQDEFDIQVLENELRSAIRRGATFILQDRYNLGAGGQPPAQV
jgi:hypothetical protein